MKIRLPFVCLSVACFVTGWAFAADTQPPTVAIAQPLTGATLSGKSTIKVTASDASGVTNVTLKIDGAAITSPLQRPPFNFALDTSIFQNGMHTLHAVATDGAGNATRSTIISVNITNPPRYKLGQGPFVLEDLGSLVSVNTQEKQIMFRLASNNDLHLLLYYDVTAIYKYPLQILDVNLSKGTTRLTDGILGRPGPYGTALHPNGKIYIGSSDPGYLVEYDPVTGTTNFISKLHPTIRRDTQTMDTGDDGWVYVGEYNSTGGGALGRYNPASSTFENLGIVDTNRVGSQYSYTIGADTRYVYVGLGQIPWYLAIYDTQTTNRTLYWKSENDTGGTVSRGIAGGFYYWRRTVSDIKWYKLEAGQPTEIAAADVPPLVPYYKRGNVVCNPENFPASFGVEINLDDAYPDSSTNHATIRWRTVGATNWQAVGVSGFRLQPINIKRLYPWDSTHFFGWADFYGPVFLFDTTTGGTTTLGRPQYSIYDGLFENDRLYLSGYTAVTLTYTPSRSWTLSGSTTIKSDPTINPHQILGGFGKYHYYSTFGADGMVYIGGHHERDSTGGELGWIDPLTGTNGSLRNPFLDNDVRDLKSVLGGTKLVYASNNEKLFVFDVASKQIERVITPIPGVGPLDKIVEVAPGIVFGATGNRVFKVDIRDGSVLYTNTLSGLAFGVALAYDHRLVLGPDGLVWMFIVNSLYRINPTDGAMTKLMDTPAKSLLFKDGDLYLYGGPNLYRVRGVLKPLSLAAPTGVHTK